MAWNDLIPHDNANIITKQCKQLDTFNKFNNKNSELKNQKSLIDWSSVLPE